MSSVLQRMAVLQAVPSAAAEAMETDPDAADMARLAELMPADETQLLYSICLHGRGELGLAPDEYAALTMVLLRLLAFKPATGRQPTAEKKTLNDAVRAAVALKPAPPPPGQQLPVVNNLAALAESRKQEVNRPPETSGQANHAAKIEAIPVRVQADSRIEAMAGQTVTTVLVPTEEGEFWHATVQQLVAQELITALVRELALQAQLVARDTDEWLLRVERESLNQAGTRDRLVSALNTAGYGVRLVVEVGRVTDSPARRNRAAAEQAQLIAEKIIFNDPFVQTMMNEFGAKIVPGSIKPD